MQNVIYNPIAMSYNKYRNHGNAESICTIAHGKNVIKYAAELRITAADKFLLSGKTFVKWANQRKKAYRH